MGELTNELIEQQKRKIEALENRIIELENGTLVREAQSRNHALMDANTRLERVLGEATESARFYRRIITYFLDKEGQ